MQQVNLYQPILRKQEKVFSAKTLLQGNLVVLGALLLLYLFTALQTGSMEEQLKQAQQQRDLQAKQVAALAAQYPVRKKDDGLKAKLEQARIELQHTRNLLAAVGELGLDGELGFSEHMTGLARQNQPQLWLQRIFLQHGKQAELIGSATQPEEVPLYLQRLGEEQAFEGTAFLSVLIARNEEHPAQVDFTLSTKAQEEKP